MKSSDLINDNIKLLIVGYLTGSIEKDELSILNDWINSGDENRRYFNSIKDSWILSGGMSQNLLINTERSWNTFSNKLFQHSSGSDSLNKRRKQIITKYLRIAASWLLIFCLGSAVTWWISGRKGELPAVAKSINNGIVEVTVPLGSKSLIKMPDSTKIWLNAGTRITYNQDYGHQNRTLNLSGEAYFDVAKDNLNPFIVNTQCIVVRALGTRFNIKAYPEEKTTSATLEEGKIDVRVLGLTGNDNRVLLKPKDKLIFHKETKSTEKYTESPEDNIRSKQEVSKKINLKNVNIVSNVRTELYTSWKDPRWIIDSEPLSTLVPMLERRFNLKIIFVNEQLKRFRFTGIVENETVDQLLNALRLTAPIDYLINKDTLRLTLDFNASEKFRKAMSRNN